jgi:hypothetical protein
MGGGVKFEIVEIYAHLYVETGGKIIKKEWVERGGQR